MDNRTIEQVRENEDHLIKEVDKVEEKLKRAKEVINGMIDNEEKYCLEIERLNNIINELEKYCNEEIIDYDKALNNKVFVLTEKGKESYEAEKMCFLDMLDKLQKLKGEDKE